MSPTKETTTSMTTHPVPRGRPPTGYVWAGGKYIDQATGETFCSARSTQRARQRRRAYERARYWDLTTKVRLKRLERAARESGRPRRPVQLKLDQIISASSVTDAAPKEAQPDKGDACVQIPEKRVCARINHLTDP